MDVEGFRNHQEFVNRHHPSCLEVSELEAIRRNHEFQQVTFSDFCSVSILKDFPR